MQGMMVAHISTNNSRGCGFKSCGHYYTFNLRLKSICKTEEKKDTAGKMVTPFIMLFSTVASLAPFLSKFVRLEPKSSVCGAVGRAVASDTRDTQFESSHQQILFTINYIEKTK